MKPAGAVPLRIRPWTVKRATALAFVHDVHRKLPDVQGAMWCLSARSGNEIVGVALVGWPAQEQTNNEIDTLCVLRVAVKLGNPNACSMLYGACWRTARAMGVDNLVTYTHIDEPGTSLRAAGWIEDGMPGGGELDRRSRRRAPVRDARPKRRWWAPGSKRAPRRVSLPLFGGTP